MNLLGGPVGGWLAVCAFGWTARGRRAVSAVVPAGRRLALPRAPRGAANTRGLGDRAQQLQADRARARCGGRPGCCFSSTWRPGSRRRCSTTSRTSSSSTRASWASCSSCRVPAGSSGRRLYAYLCRRFPLKVSLIAGISLDAASTLLYLRYDSARSRRRSSTAAAALLSILATLPLYDLAARATPAGRRELRVLADDEHPQRRASSRSRTRRLAASTTTTTSVQASWSGSTRARRRPCCCSSPRFRRRCWRRARGQRRDHRPAKEIWPGCRHYSVVHQGEASRVSSGAPRASVWPRRSAARPRPGPTSRASRSRSGGRPTSKPTIRSSRR